MSHPALSAGNLASTSRTVAAEESAAGPAHGTAVPQKELESELALAVQHGDIRRAQQALLHGADPNKVSVRQAGDGMRALMSYARRVKALYPPEGMAVGADTPLDRGLQAGIETWNETLKAPVFATPSRPVSEQQHRAQRRMIWRNATEQQRRAHVRVLWRNATSANNADVQRALLLLEAHKDPGFRLMEAGKVENAAVAKVMKEIPYLSPKRGLPRNYNCQVRFVASGAESTSRESPSTGRPIACRHFVEHLQARQEQTEHGKFDYAEFANPEAIAENVTIGTDAGVKSFVSTAAETHMFRNRDFGQMLIEQFTKMKAQGQAHRLMALVSTRHMMSLRLRIKLKDGKERFVVTFFDPQITTSHVRAVQ